VTIPIPEALRQREHYLFTIKPTCHEVLDVQWLWGIWLETFKELVEENV
jgi:hypothetical protein